MSEVYEPNAAFRDRAHVKSMEDYQGEYDRSIADPEAFWADKATEFHWFKIVCTCDNTTQGLCEPEYAL